MSAPPPSEAERAVAAAGSTPTSWRSGLGRRQLAAQARGEAARRSVDQLVARDKADRLASVLAEIAGHNRDLDRTDAELAGIALTGEGMRAIETANAAVDVARAPVELVSASGRTNRTRRHRGALGRRIARARGGRLMVDECQRADPTLKSRVY